MGHARLFPSNSLRLTPEHARVLSVPSSSDKDSKDPATPKVLPVSAEAAAGAKKAVENAQTEIDLKILRSLVPYIWPPDKPEHRMRVVGALSFLIGSKLLNVGTPLMFKCAVDALAVGSGAAVTGPAALATLPVVGRSRLTPG